jgi:aminocarboxymuconate-semialdehyde decarboxylase
MTTRRNFLRSAALAGGMAFCGCGLAPAAKAQPGQGHARLPVRVGGQRVKTIDVHSHCLFHEATSLLGAEEKKLTPPIRYSKAAYIVIEDRLKSMDAQAVDMEVLSINPYWYGKDRDLAAKIVSIQNEKLAELVAAHPDRFAAFASLTLQDPQLAVKELETAMRKQGLKGAAIGDVVGKTEFSDPRFDPVWAKAEELGAVLFIHPQGVLELKGRFRGNGWLANLIGNPLSTTIALEHLIFQGTLDRYPGLKILAAHGGGYLGSYPDRSDYACFVGEKLCDPNIKLKRHPSEYLRQIYVDSLVFSPEALRHLAAVVGASQIVLGSDNPYAWQPHPVDHVFATETLTDQEKAAILGNNATALFGIKS